MVPWWDQTKPASAQAKKEMAENTKEAFRTGIKVLHDWLNTFAIAGSLETLKFTWKATDGPNPLLLDLVVAQHGNGSWFSAPAIKWRSLQNVWLRGMFVDGEDVRQIKDRAPGLQTLMVQAGREGETIRGKRVLAKGKKWFEVAMEETSRKQRRMYRIGFMGNIDFTHGGSQNSVNCNYQKGEGHVSEEEQDHRSASGAVEVPIMLDVASMSRSFQGWHL